MLEPAWNEKEEHQGEVGWISKLKIWEEGKWESEGRWFKIGPDGEILGSRLKLTKGCKSEEEEEGRIQNTCYFVNI